jgi:uncharacterized protein (TIGR02246 family)
MARTFLVSLIMIIAALSVARAERPPMRNLSEVPGHISNPEGNDTAGVLKLIEGFQISLFNGEARAFANLFAEDADFINVVDRAVHGRENIYKHHVPVFKNRPASRTNNLLSYSVRFLKPDLAASEIKWNNKHTKGPNGTTLPDRDGVWVSVMSKENGKWYFKVVRNVMLNDGTKPPRE